MEMKERNTHFYAHACTRQATTRHAQINRQKHTGKKHKPFGTGSLSREGFKAHWHEFMITPLCLCQTWTVVVFPLTPFPSFLYALPSPWSKLWKMQAGVPQFPWKAVCLYVCFSAHVTVFICVLRMGHSLLVFLFFGDFCGLLFSSSTFNSFSSLLWFLMPVGLKRCLIVHFNSVLHRCLTLMLLSSPSIPSLCFCLQMRIV